MNVRGSVIISVITTVKNGGKYLEDTLKSVCNQSYKNYEHIIVDDGSTDNTIAIIQKFHKANIDYNLQLYQPGELGRGKALNYGVGKALGKWIAIIDADDLWHPDKLQTQYEILCDNNIDVLATGNRLFTKTNEIDFVKKIIEKREIIFFNTKNLLKSNQLCHSSVIIRKELGIYDEHRKSQYDYELWLRLISANKRLAKITQDLTYHRIHPNQSFESKMGRGYAWRAYKLNALYSLKFGQLYFLGYASLKFLIRMIFSKKTITELFKK